jgi:hypothetical protein
LYRVHALISPQIACRFDDKREQYAVVFWMRVAPNSAGNLEARITEVEAHGQRLVRATYEELLHRRKLNVSAPDMTETLVLAGLDPFRAPIMWRRWSREAAARWVMPNLATLSAQKVPVRVAPRVPPQHVTVARAPVASAQRKIAARVPAAMPGVIPGLVESGKR